MCSVMQNPLPGPRVACVPFVITAGFQTAIVFRERRGGDDDVQAVPTCITQDRFAMLNEQPISSVKPIHKSQSNV